MQTYSYQDYSDIGCIQQCEVPVSPYNKEQNVMKHNRFLIAGLLALLPIFGFSADQYQSIIVSTHASSKATAVNLALKMASDQAHDVLLHAQQQDNNVKSSKPQASSPVQAGKQVDLYCEELSDKSFFVVMRAAVNLSQLSAAMVAKGEGEVARTALESKATKRQFQELNSRNETEIINALFKHLGEMRPLFDYKIAIGKKLIPAENNSYMRAATVYLYSNENTNRFAKMYISTFSLISMRKDEQKTDRLLNRYHFTFYLPNGQEVILRNNYRRDNDNVITDKLAKLISKRAESYAIADNVNNPTKLKIIDGGSELYTRTRHKVGRIAGSIGRIIGGAAVVLATGGAGWGLMSSDSAPTKVIRMFDYKETFSASDASKVGEFDHELYIPSNKLNTYTDFKVVSIFRQ